MSDPRPRFAVRAATRDDWPCIINNWLKSNRRSPLAAHLRNSVYFEQHAPMVRCALVRAATAVAYPVVPANSQDEIAGWLCWERNGGELVVHFAYTQKLYRKMGVARELLKHAGWAPGEELTATHITHVYTDWTDVRVKYRISNDPYRFVRSYGVSHAQAVRSQPA